MSRKSFTFISCVFGDNFWESLLLEKIQQSQATSIDEVILVDQNLPRNFSTQIQIDRVRRISFEPDSDQLLHLGHDHASALNKAIRLPFKSSHVVIMDSDCIPLSSEFFEKLQEIEGPVLASDPSKFGLTHPCFMALPTSCLGSLDFSEGLLELGIDTGRLIGLQLSRGGFQPLILPSSVAPWGKGHLYMGGLLYHHGSGSMLSSSDRRLSKQVSNIGEAYFRRRLVAASLRPSILDSFFLFISLAEKFLRAIGKLKASNRPKF